MSINLNHLVPEPLGFTKPRFSGSTQVMSGFLHTGGGALTLGCPAQSFPPSVFKYAFQMKSLISLL